MLKIIASAIALACLSLAVNATAALAQSSPSLTYGQVPSPAQWNGYFSSKQDFLGFSPVNRAGDTMVGPLKTPAGTVNGAGFSIAPGVAPSSPSNGDLWMTSVGLFARIGGLTVGPTAFGPALTQVSSNTALSTFAAPGVTTAIRRLGFYAAGDGGAADYVYSSSTCSLNSGAGDNGSQVRATGGGCWIAAFSGEPDARVWGADGTFTSVSTTAINAWAAYVTSHHISGRLAAGTYKLDACLAPITSDRWRIHGDGGSTSILVYTGTSTTCDIMSVIGASLSAALNDVHLNDLRVTSNTVMTAGNAVHFKFAQYMDTNGLIIDGSFFGNRALYDGIFFENSSFVRYYRGDVWTSHYGIKASGGVELVIDGGTHLYNIGDSAIYIGGGYGGVYLGSVSELGASIGLRIDTSLTGTANNQIFVSDQAVFDTNIQGCVFVNDAIAASKSFLFDGWCASNTTTGSHGITLVNWTNGTFNVGGGAQILNNAGDGIYYGDASVRMSIDPAANITYNSGYGLMCAVSAPSLVSWFQGANNISGDYSPLCAAGQIVQPPTSYAPTITTASGTITTLGAVTGTYTRTGKMVTAALSVSVTTNGTGAGTLYATLPIAAVSDSFQGAGRDINLGTQLQVTPVAGQLGKVAVISSANAYSASSGSKLNFSITYQVP